MNLFKDGCDGITCGINEKCTLRNNKYPICQCKDGYKIDRYTKMCVEDETGKY